MAKKATTTKKDKETRSEIEILIAKMKPSMVRFVSLYMGGEDGSCFNNATRAYLRAYEIDTPTVKVKQEDGKDDYTKEYKSAKSNGYELLTKTDIQRLRRLILSEQGFDPKNIKNRYAELGYQNKNLPIALTAMDRVAKIAGVVSDDKKVDIPQLTQLGEALKDILTPKK